MNSHVTTTIANQIIIILIDSQFTLTTKKWLAIRVSYKLIFFYGSFSILILKQNGITEIDALTSFHLAPLASRRNMAMLGAIHRAVLGEGPHN